MALYFFNTTTGQSTLIGTPKANSNLNSSSADQWQYFQQGGNVQWPFDDIASATTGHLIMYENGVDINNKQIIMKTDLTGTPAYQLGAAPGLMDQTPAGCAPSYPSLFSVQVACHGMTAVFTNITPASLGKDLLTQVSTLPGYKSWMININIDGVANGYIILEVRGNQNTIGLFARLNPATGLIDNSTTSWTQPNCRWCIDHSGAQMQGNVNYMGFGTDAVGSDVSP